MKLVILVLLLMVPQHADAGGRFLEQELRDNCTALYPGKVSLQSICLNATGTCVVLYMKDRQDGLTEDMVMAAIETCTKHQYEANVEYFRWSEKNGVKEMYRKYMSGVVSQKEAMRNANFRIANECRVRSKKDGYTNYARMWECIKMAQ